MKQTSLFVRMLLVVVTMGLASPAMAQDSRNRRVTVHNHTDYTMRYFYASNTGRTGWEEDILGSSVVLSGDSIHININDGTGRCRFDMKAVFSNGMDVIRQDVNVCAVSNWYINN